MKPSLFVLTIASICLEAGAARAAVNLAAVAVGGPKVVTAGTQVDVSRTIESSGKPPPEVLVYDYRLDGVVIATRTSENIPVLADSIQVPFGFAPGLHRWELAVGPAAKEKDLDDNVAIGGFVLVLPAQPQLCLDAGPVVDVFDAIEDPAPPPPLVLHVQNCVDTTLLLPWTAEFSPRVGWAALENASGVAGFASPSPLAIDFDTHGLAPGIYETALVLTRVDDPTQTLTVALRLRVDELQFVPGDAIQGAFETAGDIDPIWFDGVAGMTLRLRQDKTDNPLDLTAWLEDAAGNPAGAVEFHHAKKEQRSLALQSSGRVRLKVRSTGGAIGPWRLATDRKLPKSAYGVAKSAKISKDDAGGLKLKLPALAGTRLDALLSPKLALAGTWNVAILPPGGKWTFCELLALPETAMFGFGDWPLPASGVYTIEVTTSLPVASKVKVELHATPPAKGDATVTISD